MMRKFSYDFCMLLILHKGAAFLAPTSVRGMSKMLLQEASATASGVEVEPFCLHPIDYSAANEYIGEHYRHVFRDEAYFGNGNPGPFDEDNYMNHPREPIYDARQGVIKKSSSGDIERSPPRLAQDGFTLFQAPTKVTNFNDLPQIKSVYIPELQQTIENDVFPGQELSHVVFWNPMFRGEQQKVSNAERDMTSPNSPTSPTAGMVHIDQDLGAHSTDSILGLIQNNRLLDEDGKEFPKIKEAIDNGHRFAILNFWRNAGSEPIRRQPLAVLSPHYSTGTYFPNDKPDPESSFWYTFPEMTPDEVLVFKQYDRDGSFLSDIWHCALKSVVDESAPPRESFDIRALVVFPEKVESNKDRFSEDRLQPVLDLEQSGEFCDEQAEKRSSQK